jgi:hypothetical protein
MENHSESLPCRIQCTDSFAAGMAHQAPDISRMLRLEARHPQRHRLPFTWAPAAQQPPSQSTRCSSPSAPECPCPMSHQVVFSAPAPSPRVTGCVGGAWP